MSLLFNTTARSCRSSRALLGGVRFNSTGSADYETEIQKKLKDALKSSSVSVQDISGGCGSMFAIDIVSPAFKGLRTIQQHQLVNKILADDISKWHGLRLSTKPPTKD